MPNDGTSKGIKQPDRYTGADVLRKAAERMRRDGRTATAIMLDNAAWLAEGHEPAELHDREIQSTVRRGRVS